MFPKAVLDCGGGRCCFGREGRLGFSFFVYGRLQTGVESGGLSAIWILRVRE